VIASHRSITGNGPNIEDDGPPVLRTAPTNRRSCVSRTKTKKITGALVIVCGLLTAFDGSYAPTVTSGNCSLRSGFSEDA
jgi:hypothetical protein